MDMIISVALAIIFFVVLTVLFFFRDRLMNWVRRNKKKAIGIGVSILLASAGTGYILSLGDEQPPFIDPAAFIWHLGNSYGGMPHWEINKTYAKQFLKDNMKWRLQASPNNNTWYDANELLKIGLDWNDIDCSYKVTLTLNTTGAPQALYYRFDLACDKSLKQYAEINGYVWTLTIPANNTMDYTILFNWSDIKPLIQSGKVWYDRGVTNNFFWFRIQSVNKIGVGKEFVVDPVYGVIPAAVIETWEWDQSEGRTVGLKGLVRVNNSEYYLTVASGDGDGTGGGDGDGWATVIQVDSDNGNIINAGVISRYEYDGSDGSNACVLHIPGTDKYVVYYYDTGSAKTTLVTLQVWDNNGTIKQGVIDSQQCTYDIICSYFAEIDFIAVTDNVYMVAYSQTTTNDGYIETWWIDYDGMINNTRLDIEEFDETYGNYPRLCMVDSNTVAINYLSASSTGSYAVITHNVTSSGIISNTPADSWAYETEVSRAGGGSGNTLAFNKVGSNVFATTYVATNFSIYCKTIGISDKGMMTNSFIDKLLVTTTTGANCLITFIVHNPLVASDGNGIMGCTYIVDNTLYDGYVRTWNISSAGVIGNAIIDYLLFAGTLTYNAWVVYVNQSFYFSVFTGASNDGFCTSYSIATNWASPVFSSPSPTNSSVDVSLTPRCNITVNDKNGDTMRVTFAENSTGSWVNRQTNGSVANGTYRWDYTQASSYSKKYWWKVYCNDGQHNVSKWYCFTTGEEPNSPPTNTYVGAWDLLKNIEWEFNTTQVKAPPWTLNISISDPDGDRMNWTIYHNDGGTWKVVASGTNSPNGTNTTTNTTWIDEYGVQYDISVNITDGTVWLNNSRHFTTNNPPDISDYSPANEATGVELTPRCSITIDDDDGDTMDVLWEEYQVPVYADVQTNNTVGNGTYTYDYVNATNFMTNYGWRVSVDDGIDITELTLSFTTRAQYATSVSLSGLTSDWNVTWNGTTPTGSTNVHTVFINNSGDRYETVEINIVVNDTMLVDNIYFWAMWLNDTVNNTQIYTDNITVWVSDDNVTWGVLQHDIGNGMGRFPHTMGYLHWNWTTEPDGVEAFPYTPIKGYVISSNTTLYARYQLNITDTAVEGIYYNLTAWEISVVNESSGDGIGVINSASHTCKAKVEQGWINTAPVQSNPAPANNSYDNTRTIMLNITVGDIDDATQDMSITWQTNSSGSWVTFGTNNTVNNGTYRQPMENFTIPGTKYWWRIILTDNEGGWDNDTYCLTMNNDTVWYKSSGYNCYLEIDSLSFDPIIVSNSYVMFNTTDFKVTSTNRTNISIIFINTSITDATAGDLLVDFCAHNTGGIVWFNISGFTYTVNYSVYKNSVLLGYDVADVNGDISFSDTINGYTPRYQIYFNIVGSVSYNTTIRNTGIDYFVWLGGNTTAVNVASIITGFNEAAEYIAIWNESQAAWDNTNGLWAKYYGDGSGDNFDIQTFDVVRCYLTDSGTQNFDMTSNPDMNYTKSYNITLSNLTRNKGFNYTGYNRVSSTTLDTINSSIGIPEGYYVGRWNETTYTWDFWISGFSTVDYTVERWAVVMTKVDGTRWWNT